MKNGFEVHTLDKAPQGSKPPLSRLKADVGLIPNLAGTMAESPCLVEAFVTLREIFQRGTFTPLERETLLLTNAVENGCPYCTAAHSTFAASYGISKESLEAMRQGRSPQEAKLKALSDFARQLIQTRGNGAETERQAFLKAGYTNAQSLEVLVGLAISTIANFTHHMTEAPLDDIFSACAVKR